MEYKSTKNDGFVNKLKELYDNGNNNKNNNKNNKIIYRKYKRTESQVKLNKKLFKLNTEKDIGKPNEGLRISIKSNKKQKVLKTKTNKKIITRKSTSDIKSNYKYFSPEKLNKFRVSNKFKLKKDINIF